MRAIKDIRVYRSQTENIAGNPLPHEFANRALHVMLHRIAMHLGAQGFTMGDFHHLYINLTTCAADEKIAPSGRGKDSNSPWFRYYDVTVSQAFYDTLETPDCIEGVLAIVEQVLMKYFCTEQHDAAMIRTCISEAAEQGAHLLIRFREKRTSKNKAVIYLRYLDNNRYFPLLRVYDPEDRLLFEKDLPETNHLDAYGTIQLSAKKVTIQPRKNHNTENAEPMTFVLSSEEAHFV